MARSDDPGTVSGVHRRNRHAFTMIELVVVIVILGVLSTIAYVSYSAVTEKTKDSGPQQALTSVAGAEASEYERTGAFSDASGLPSIESAYTYTSTAATGAVISVALGTDNQGNPVVGLAALATNGSCLEMLVHPPDGSAANQTGTLSSGSSCTGQAALTPSGATW